MPSPRRIKLIEKFWSNVEKTNIIPDGFSTPHWFWNGPLRPDGYGQLYSGHTGYLAHRFSFELAGNTIPPKLQLDHLCRVRKCVNPTHLEPVTRKENILRGVSPTALNAAKTKCPRGHPYDDDNTYTSPSGKRYCRICMAKTMRKTRRKKVKKDTKLKLLTS